MHFIFFPNIVKERKGQKSAKIRPLFIFLVFIDFFITPIPIYFFPGLAPYWLCFGIEIWQNRTYVLIVRKNRDILLAFNHSSLNAADKYLKFVWILQKNNNTGVTFVRYVLYIGTGVFLACAWRQVLFFIQACMNEICIGDLPNQHGRVTCTSFCMCPSSPCPVCLKLLSLPPPPGFPNFILCTNRAVWINWIRTCIHGSCGEGIRDNVSTRSPSFFTNLDRWNMYYRICTPQMNDHHGTLGLF